MSDGVVFDVGFPGGADDQPAPAFDLGFGVSPPSTIASELAVSQQAAAQLADAIRHGIISALAGAAVSTDQLREIVQRIVERELSTASESLRALQQPIVQAIVNSLSAALESAAPLGVTPPPVDGVPSLPAPVQPALSGIPPAQGAGSALAAHTQEALSGILGNAVRRYQSDALPFIAIDPARYGAALRQIEAIIPANTSAAASFANYVLTQETARGLAGATPSAGAPMPAFPPTLSDAALDASQSATQTIAQSATQQSATVTAASQSLPSCLSLGTFTIGFHNWSAYDQLLSYIADCVRGMSCDDVAALCAGGKRRVATIVSIGNTTFDLVIAPGGAPGTCVAYADAPPDFVAAWPVFSKVITLPCTPPVPPPVPPPPPPPVPPPTTPPPPPPTPPDCPPCPPPPPPPKFDLYCVGEGQNRRPVVLPHESPPPTEQPSELLVNGGTAAQLIGPLISACRPTCKEGEKGPPLEFLPLAFCNELIRAVGMNIPGNVPMVSVALGLRDRDGTPIEPKLPSGSSALTQVIVGAAADFMRFLADAASAILPSLIQSPGPDCVVDLSVVAARIVHNVVSWVSGNAFDFRSISLDQAAHFQCPTLIPDPINATSAWLANNISLSELECWVRANNMRFPEWFRVADSARAKLTPLQLAALLLRGELTEQQFAERIRELGYIRPTDARDFRVLAQQIPPVSDLTRFMVRDVADEELVRRFGMDDEFGVKFAGRIVEWSRNQGVDTEYMRAVWRAHWSIPSPTQLFSMFHRLRNLPPGDPRRVELGDIEAALRQQDVLPYWIPKLLAISFNLPRLVDLRRAYYQGSIDDQTLQEQLSARGYSDRDVQIMVMFFRREKQRRFVRAPDTNRFISGELSRDEWEALLRQAGASDDDIATAEAAVSIYRRANRRRQCIRSLKRRFLRGEFQAPDAVSRLVSEGVPTDAANEIVAGWECEVRTKGKELSAGAVCRMLEDGLVSPADFVRRLENVGWDRDDAVLLLQSCQRRLGIKLAKSEAARIRQETAELEKAQRQRKALEKEAVAEAERRARAAEKAQRIQSARRRMLLEAAAAWSSLTEKPLPDAYAEVSATYSALKSSTPLPLDDILRALLTAVKLPVTVAAPELLVITREVLEEQQLENQPL